MSLLAAGVALPALTVASPAKAAVTVGENISAFPNRDMVVAVGYDVGEVLTIEVLRNGTIIGTTTGRALDTPEGVGLEVNHGPEGTPAPGECWTNYTPDIIGGDLIRVTTPRGVDTMTVADIDFAGNPRLDGAGNVVVDGTASGLSASDIAVEFRRDKPEPRFRRGPFPATFTTPTTWSSTFRPTATTSPEGLTTQQQRDIALNEASWAAVVDNITETTLAELGEAPGVAPGCPGTSEANAVAAGYTEPVNIASGDITLSGTAREGVSAVSITVGGLAAKTATLSTNATGTKTWTLDVTKAELATLADGNITITSSFDGLAGANRTMVKDTQAPAAPTESPAAGNYPTAQSVALTKPAGETTSRIFWAIGGATVPAPDASDNLYVGQIAVTSTQTIKARVIDAAGNLGAVGTFAYTIGPPPPPPPPPDGTAPTVTARGPASGATGVSVSSNVTATFSEAVLGVSVSTFTLKRTSDGAAVTAGVFRNGTSNQWILDPSANLANSTQYTATLTGGATAVRDGSGNPLANTSWNFTTAAAVVNAAPTVTARVPASSATSVSLTNNLTATFNEAVTGVSGTTFVLKNSAGANVAASVSYNATTRMATLNPTLNLTADRRYTLTLTGGASAIRDTAGAPLVTTTWGFTTGPAPTVTTRAPASSATGVSVSGNITATFSEAVSSVNTTTFRLRNATTGAAVTATVTRNGTTNQWILNPSANLTSNVRYTATLTGGTAAVRDAAGNPLVTTSWTFLVGTRPTVTTKSPATNATGVGRTANVTATFSEAVTGVSATTFRLRNATTGASVSGVVARNGTTNQWILNPGVTLAANTRYTATLTGGSTAIRDLAGNTLTTLSWSFTTGG